MHPWVSRIKEMSKENHSTIDQNMWCDVCRCAISFSLRLMPLIKIFWVLEKSICNKNLVHTQEFHVNNHFLLEKQ